MIDHLFPTIQCCKLWTPKYFTIQIQTYIASGRNQKRIVTAISFNWPPENSIDFFSILLLEELYLRLKTLQDIIIRYILTSSKNINKLINFYNIPRCIAVIILRSYYNMSYYKVKYIIQYVAVLSMMKVFFPVNNQPETVFGENRRLTFSIITRLQQEKTGNWKQKY